MFLLVAVVYPTINYKTWGNNELHYTPFAPGTKIICDEWLWQPPQNCRTVYIITDTKSEEIDESLSIKFSPLYYGDAEFYLDWCSENDGLWNENDSTCYFANEEDLEKGIIAMNNMENKN